LREALAFAEKTTREFAIAQTEKVGLQDSEIKVDRLPDGAESYRVRVVVTGFPELE